MCHYDDLFARLFRLQTSLKTDEVNIKINQSDLFNILFICYFSKNGFKIKNAHVRGENEVGRLWQTLLLKIQTRI